MWKLGGGLQYLGLDGKKSSFSFDVTKRATYYELTTVEETNFLEACLQESYCGYPGFHLNCSKHGYPTISLPENDYIVESISYPNRSFRVYNAAVSSTSNLRCLPQIINTTFPTREFRYVNASMLYLLSNCTEPLSNDLLQYKVVCHQGEKRDNFVLALWDEDENLQNGFENCEKHVVAPVELHGDEERIGMGEYEEILRRGFALNWSVAGDCGRCERSGGRCGFNTTTFRFRCFCRDGPRWSCRPRTDSGTLFSFLSLSIYGM
ncbi:unnamed protein product [Fraxinus pennsylvanica]|uniref:non-specific serine/threonine protein kinase n=1 Tax=Fraxinus pennsylvanica TaxID=56036 RepID=A0AAD2A093_9LAMI|nr:unnamed protein product [Fraxinus pennsylvanica]